MAAGHTDAVRALKVVGERLFSGSYDGSVRAWSATSLLPLGCMRQHKGPVRTLVHSGRCIFSGSYDHTICAWHTDVRAPPPYLWCNLVHVLSCSAFIECFCILPAGVGAVCCCVCGIGVRCY